MEGDMLLPIISASPEGYLLDVLHLQRTIPIHLEWVFTRMPFVEAQLSVVVP